MDLGIQDLNSNVLIVNNIGGKPLPFNIRMTFADGTTAEQEVNTDIWQNGGGTSIITLEPKKPLKKVEIRIPHGRDANADNNVWEVK